MPENAQPATAELLSHFHIIDCISSSISADGATALMVFRVKDNPDGEPRKFAITVAAPFLPLLRAVVHDTLSKLPPAPPSNMAMAFKSIDHLGREAIEVGGCIEQPNVCLLRTNPGRPEEISFVITLQTCAALGKLCADVPIALAAEITKHKKLQ